MLKNTDFSQIIHLGENQATQDNNLPVPKFQNIADGFMVTVFDAEYSLSNAVTTQAVKQKNGLANFRQVFAG